MRYWNNDAVGYVDALIEVLRNCRRKTSKYIERLGVSNDVEEMGRLRVSVDEWKGNIARVGLVLASQLVEMKVSSVDYNHFPSGFFWLFGADGSGCFSNLPQPPVCSDHCATRTRTRLDPLSYTAQLHIFIYSLGIWTVQWRI
jgi:hypothetical protein